MKQPDVTVTTTLRNPPDSAPLAAACRAALRHEGVAAATVEIHVVGDRRMRALNREHLGHDYTTDVLSFSLGELPGGGMLGTVVVCRDEARRQARERRIPETEELCRYVVHGVLHALGYEDATPKERDAMWAVQEAIVAAL